MKTLVIFDSQFGNTERLADVIARQLGADAPLWAADGAAKAALVQHDWNLLVVGAPTQNHTVSPTMRALLQGVPHKALKDAHVAVFDTRYRLARLLSGSAADWIAARLASAGAALVVAPESFFVERKASRDEHGTSPSCSSTGALRGLPNRLRLPILKVV
jgi:flavodoxin